MKTMSKEEASVRAGAIRIGAGIVSKPTVVTGTDRGTDAAGRTSDRAQLQNDLSGDLCRDV